MKRIIAVFLLLAAMGLALGTGGCARPPNGPRGARGPVLETRQPQWRPQWYRDGRWDPHWVKNEPYRPWPL